MPNLQMGIMYQPYLIGNREIEWSILGFLRCILMCFQPHKCIIQLGLWVE